VSTREDRIPRGSAEKPFRLDPVRVGPARELPPRIREIVQSPFVQDTLRGLAGGDLPPIIMGGPLEGAFASVPGGREVIRLHPLGVSEGRHEHDVGLSIAHELGHILRDRGRAPAADAVRSRWDDVNHPESRADMRITDDHEQYAYAFQEALGLLRSYPERGATFSADSASTDQRYPGTAEVYGELNRRLPSYLSAVIQARAKGHGRQMGEFGRKGGQQEEDGAVSAATVLGPTPGIRKAERTAESHRPGGAP
jgi:hypothetical protein